MPKMADKASKLTTFGTSLGDLIVLTNTSCVCFDGETCETVQYYVGNKLKGKWELRECCEIIHFIGGRSFFVKEGYEPLPIPLDNITRWYARPVSNTTFECYILCEKSLYIYSVDVASGKVTPSGGLQPRNGFIKATTPKNGCVEYCPHFYGSYFWNKRRQLYHIDLLPVLPISDVTDFDLLIDKFVAFKVFV